MKPVQQFRKEQMIRQQQILAHLGHYRGRIDGIWGRKTMEAKKAFELKGFAPGVPNGGLPFDAKGPYPRGIFMNNGLLDCAGFDPAKWPEYVERPEGPVSAPQQKVEPDPQPEPTVPSVPEEVEEELKIPLNDRDDGTSGSNSDKPENRIFHKKNR